MDKPIFENKTCRQIKRRGTQHRHLSLTVPHNCQASDVAAGEKQRPDHMRVGADGKLQASRGFQHRRIVSGTKRGIYRKAGRNAFC